MRRPDLSRWQTWAIAAGVVFVIELSWVGAATDNVPEGGVDAVGSTLVAVIALCLIVAFLCAIRRKR